MCGDPVKFNFTNICVPKSQSSLIVEKQQENMFKISVKQHINKLVKEREYLLPELQDSDKGKSGYCLSFVHTFMHFQNK